MRLIQAVKQRWMPKTTLPEIANEVAERCNEAVWQRVQYQVSTLTPSQARGYIRARAVAIIHPQLAAATARHDVAPHLLPQLYALTMEAVIQRIQSQVEESTGHRQLRRAA